MSASDSDVLFAPDALAPAGWPGSSSELLEAPLEASAASVPSPAATRHSHGAGRRFRNLSCDPSLEASWGMLERLPEDGFVGGFEESSLGVYGWRQRSAVWWGGAGGLSVEHSQEFEATESIQPLSNRAMYDAVLNECV
jgi:hypothetical protein